MVRQVSVLDNEPEDPYYLNYRGRTTTPINLAHVLLDIGTICKF